MATTQATKNTITLRGSTEIVTEFFGFSINSILYQRGIYPSESFTKVNKYGLSMLVTTDEGLKKYLGQVLNQLSVYLKTQGIDPNEHPVREELKRVQEYMGKLRERSMKQTSAPTTTTQQHNQQEARPVVTVNKEVAHKFFTHALNKKQHSATEDAAAPEDRQKQQNTDKKKKKKRETSNDKTGESPKKRRKNK